ncbi:MAG: hypothetical protein EOM26_03615 [Alphaproteobacteria bacterium]|nr:hypothetical protein [Alphaproteobacteria bacterium]
MSAGRKGVIAGLFAISAAFVAAPFIVTSTTGTDYCLVSARELASAFRKEAQPTTTLSPARLIAASVTSGEGEWKIRMALTPFPFVRAVHTSLELVPASVRGSSRKEAEFYQIHGVIRDAADSEPASIRPCDAGSLWRQFTGGHILQGTVVRHDLNRPLLGRDPVSYVDLAFGSKEEMLERLTDIQRAVDVFNERRLTYGFIREPNSNTLVFNLLDELGLMPRQAVLTPVRDRSAPWWAPGFRQLPPYPAPTTGNLDYL